MDERILDEYRNNRINLSIARIHLMSEQEKKIAREYIESGSLSITAKENAISEEQVAEIIQKAEVYADRKRRLQRYEGKKEIRDVEILIDEEVIKGTETVYVIDPEKEKQFLEKYINELSPESGHFTVENGKDLPMICGTWIKEGYELILDMLKYTNKGAYEISEMTGEHYSKVKRIISLANQQKRLYNSRLKL